MEAALAIAAARAYLERMRLVSRQPSPVLAPFVSTLWYAEAAEVEDRRERILPSARMQLIVNLAGDAMRVWGGSDLSRVHRSGGAAVSGVYDGPFAIDAAEQRRVCGAVLHAGAAASVLGVPADALAGAHTDLSDVWGRAGAELRERLLEAATPEALLDTLDRVLVARLAARSDPLVSFACEQLEAGCGVSTIATEVGIGRKRLGQRFAAAVGVTPKTYARIARLQRLLRLVAAGPKSWAELAVDCGYYDQAHLILDFRELTGVTPSRYAPRSEDEHNHMAL